MTRSHLRELVAELSVGPFKEATLLQWRCATKAALAGLCLTAVSSCAPVGAALLLRTLLDDLTPPNHLTSARAIAISVALASLGALSMGATYLVQYPSEVVRRKMSFAMSDRLFSKTLAFSGLRRFEQPSFHDSLSLAEQATQRVPQTITVFNQQLLRTLVTLFAFGASALLIWPPMAFLLAVAVIPTALVRHAEARRSADAEKSVAASFRRAYQYRFMLTDARVAKEIRVFGFGQYLQSRFRESLESVDRAVTHVEQRAAAVQGALVIANATITAVGVSVVVVGAARGRYSLGDVALFIAALNACQGAITSITIQSSQLKRTLSLFGEYERLLATEDDLRTGGRDVPRLARVEFRNVWFRYNEDGPWILRDLDLTIEAGTHVGLVGLNGTGKSTIIKLLCRLYDPSRGEILWNGNDIRRLNIEELRQHIGVVFQDFGAYEFSIRDNIGIGDSLRMKDATAVEVAARNAEADEMIVALPNGYETLASRAFDSETGRSGVTLSGGEWQRLALARAYMRDDRDLMILDEPTAGLDPIAEQRINERVRIERNRRTTLLVSHRLSALRDADLILILDNGRVVERGAHDELIAAGGGYAELFERQAQPYRLQDEMAPASARKG